jgi:hypothetical protein
MFSGTPVVMHSVKEKNMERNTHSNTLGWHNSLGFVNLWLKTVDIAGIALFLPLGRFVTSPMTKSITEFCEMHAEFL